MKRIYLFLLLLCVPVLWGESTPARIALEKLAVSSKSEHAALLDELSESADPFIKVFVDAWRVGEVYTYESADEGTIVLQRVSEQFQRVFNGDAYPLSDEETENAKKNRASRSLRKSLKQITDTIDLVSPIVSVRIDAAYKLGLSQKKEYITVLEKRMAKEENSKALKAFEESILISKLVHHNDEVELQNIVIRLGELKSLRGRDFIKRIVSNAKESGDVKLTAVGVEAVRQIEYHQKLLEMWGSLFRGMSLGSVLLMVSFGLAITFGLMGIINMAHGEFIAIGGYTCYLMQNAFGSAFGVQSDAYQLFYWFALPVSFLVAASVGLVFEKLFVRFLYRRPLESLLATWGLSMVMQQTFRLIFGAANVSVETPNVLSGNIQFLGIDMTLGRLFVIAFSGLVVVLTWLLLSKTNLGLFIRSVMQNRNMAASLGIPVAKVNSMTFALGCGLASLAGSAVTLIANVGPSMGQTYIVDSFMVVVVGGVGNLVGAGLSAMGIGIVDQFLQPVFGPVMGKIIVFFSIILFLQWRPGGIFPTKSRSMDD
tara:strand:- start:282 stop:1904 length:1623 start_codon:yes stop_codon:yes gene_type:complete